VRRACPAAAARKQVRACDGAIKPAPGRWQPRRSCAAPPNVRNIRQANRGLSAARNAAAEVIELKKQSPFLGLEDVFSLAAIRLKRFVPYDALAAYSLRDEILVPVFVSGENFNLFSNLRIPLGEGLSGWVAENHKAILNGNPSVEPGYLNDTNKYSTLRSALAVPLEGATGLNAVLAIYRAHQDAFTADDLRILEALTERIGPAIEPRTMDKVNAAAVGSK